MQLPDLNRREFTKLAAAAMGGLLAGASVVRAADEPKKKDPNKPLLLQEPHICRGLNPTCKGEVKGEKNDWPARPTLPRSRTTPARAKTTAPERAAAARSLARTRARAWATAPSR